MTARHRATEIHAVGLRHGAMAADNDITANELALIGVVDNYVTNDHFQIV